MLKRKLFNISQNSFTLSEMGFRRIFSTISKRNICFLYHKEPSANLRKYMLETVEGNFLKEAEKAIDYPTNVPEFCHSVYKYGEYIQKNGIPPNDEFLSSLHLSLINLLPEMTLVDLAHSVGTMASLNYGDLSFYEHVKKEELPRLIEQLFNGSRKIKDYNSKYDIESKFYFLYRTLSELGYFNPYLIRDLRDFYHLNPKVLAATSSLDHLYYLYLNFFNTKNENSFISDEVSKYLAKSEDALVQGKEKISKAASFRLVRVLSSIGADTNSFEIKKYTNLNNLVEKTRPEFDDYLKTKVISDTNQFKTNFVNKLKEMGVEFETNVVLGSEIVDYFDRKGNTCYIITRKQEVMLENQPVALKARFRISRDELEKRGFKVIEIMFKSSNPNIIENAIKKAYNSDHQVNNHNHNH